MIPDGASENMEVLTSSYVQFLVLALGILLVVSYGYLMDWYHHARQEISPLSVPEGFVPTTHLAVLIPARNEAHAIKKCLDSLIAQDYPSHLWSVLVLDDFSSDDTARIVQDYAPPVRLIRLSDHLDAPVKGGKKAALTLGVELSDAPYLLTTDADCQLPAAWLRSYAWAFEKKNAVFVSGNVVFSPVKNPFHRFQALDLLGMMGLTMAGIAKAKMFLGNGANLGFSRKVFEKTGGYEEHRHLASGDDVFLAQKIGAYYPSQVLYLGNPDLAVQTAPLDEWKDFVRQRVRWGSKTGHYSDKRLLAAAALVFLLSVWLLLASAYGLLFSRRLFVAALLVWGLKGLIDYRYLSALARAFGRPDLLRNFWVSEWYHTVYIAWVGFLANVKKNYLWKDRKLR